MMKSDEFISMFANPQKEKTVRFATVDPAYTSGKPKLIFDGESAVSGKHYPYLDSYTPQAEDRVMLIKNVIIGKVVV